MRVMISSDSTCDLSEELLEKYGIHIIPLTVILGERSGADGREIVPEDIYRYVEETGELPGTSAPSIWEYQKYFEMLQEEGGGSEEPVEIVHFCIGSLFSGSYQNACIAAADLEGIHPVDSMNLSCGQGLLVLHAAELAQAGASAEEIARACGEMIPRIETSFIANELTYLRKGGRCSALAAFGANLLHIRPCIDLHDGIMEPGKKYRGTISKVMRAYAHDRLAGRVDIDPHRIMLVHTRCDRETIEDVRSLIYELCPDVEEVPVLAAGATITVHCGPQTLGVMFACRERAGNGHQYG